MLWPHPSRKRLATWASEPTDDGVSSHLEHCARCVAIVDEASGTEEVPIGDVLRTLLSAPDFLEDELVARAQEAKTRRAVLEILGGLAAVPWETVRILLDERRTEDD